MNGCVRGLLNIEHDILCVVQHSDAAMQPVRLVN